MMHDLIAQTMATLDEVLANTDPRLDDQYELACALGQALRLHRASVPGSEALAGRVARARAVLAGERPGRILAMLDEDALLTDLADRLDSEEDDALYAALLDVDAHAAAAAALGVPEAAAGLVQGAVDHLQAAPDQVDAIQQAAARSATSRAIAADDPARPLWDAIAAGGIDGKPRALPAKVAAFIQSQALAPVLTLPLTRAEAGQERWLAAAADSMPDLPETRPLAQGLDGDWELVLERPAAAWELVCYATKFDQIPFSVQVDGRNAPVQDDGDGRRCLVLVAGADLTIQVGEERFSVQWPGDDA
ncbi:MAG: hypothetical protein KC549_10565 [Myxococcales bacterium]|nr:hypothetical protein [Myxococcales bacterium]